jgi:hypothetical protein
MTATSGHGWSSHPPDHRRADDAFGSKASSEKQQRRVGSCPFCDIGDHVVGRRGRVKCVIPAQRGAHSLDTATRSMEVGLS